MTTQPFSQGCCGGCHESLVCLQPSDRCSRGQCLPDGEGRSGGHCPSSKGSYWKRKLFLAVTLNAAATPPCITGRLGSWWVCRASGPLPPPPPSPHPPTAGQVFKSALMGTVSMPDGFYGNQASWEGCRGVGRGPLGPAWEPCSCPNRPPARAGPRQPSHKQRQQGVCRRGRAP